METSQNKKTMLVLFGIHSCCFIMMATVGLSAAATRFSLAFSFITVPVMLWFWVKQIRGTIFLLKEGRTPGWPLIRNYLFLILMTAFMGFATWHHFQHMEPPPTESPAIHAHG